MLKKTTSVLLAVIMVINLFTFLPVSSSAEEVDVVGVGATAELSEVGASNPYDYYATDSQGRWANCTWWAWQLAYENTGVALPAWGNAGTWYQSAVNAGYYCDGNASANSIVVKNTGQYGHVQFVTDVTDTQLYVKEGGYWNTSNGYHEGWTSKTGVVGYIHLTGKPGPNFDPVDIGTDFYGSIVNLAVNKPIKVSNGNVVCGVRNGSDEQKWRFERQGDNSYKIINVANGECLDDDNYGTTDNTNIKTCGSNDSDAQRWYFRYNGSGYSLVPKCAQNLALDLVNGSSNEGNNIAAWTFVEGNGNQIYGIDHQPSFTPVDIGTNFYGSIVNLATNKPIKVSNNNVVMGVRNGSDEQKWKFERMDDRMYKITNVATGKCLDDDNYGTTDNTNIKVIGSNNELAQRWYFRNNGSGYSLVPKCAMNLAMDMVNGDSTEGNNIAAWTFVSGNGNQIFGIDHQPSFQPQDLGKSFTATILHLASGSAVTVSSDDNVLIQKNTGSTNQLWQFERMDDRMYKITNKATGKVLDLDNGGTTDNTNIQTWASLDNTHQRWYLWKNGSGYSLVPKCSMNLAMDLVNGTTTDGNNLAAWTCVSGNSNQIYQINPVTLLQDSMVTVNDIVITSDVTEVTPKVTVKANNKTLKADTDYTLSSTADIANGIGTVTVTGKNGYSGTITKNYKITIDDRNKITDSMGNQYYANQGEIVTFIINLTSPRQVNYLNGILYYNQDILEPIITDDIVYHAPNFANGQFHILTPGQIEFDVYSNTPVSLNNTTIVKMQFRLTAKGKEGWLAHEFKTPEFTWENQGNYGLETKVLTNQELYVPTVNILGDVDGDGEATIIDATYIQRYNVNMQIPITEETLKKCGDVDGDGEVSVIDATFIQRFEARIPTPYLVGEPISQTEKS